MTIISAQSKRVPTTIVDVVIIGGGLAGTLASILLGRSGCRIALIDIHDIYPPDFRAEKLSGDQVTALTKLGLLDIIVQKDVPVERATAYRSGEIVGVVTAPHYGVSYDNMVNRARQHIPSSVQFIKGQVDNVELSLNRQQVTLSNGELVEARVVILATGLGQRLMRQLGITKVVLHRAHSLTFGFDLKVDDPALFHASVIVAYGEMRGEAVDYVTIFPIGNRIRANLFSYGDHREQWTKRFTREPAEMFRQTFPHLENTIGKIQKIGRVELSVNDMMVASNYLRDGLVLVGDAFQTSSPACGSGVTRVLSDIDVLCNGYISKWLSSDGMDKTKISQFYNDPAKRKCDAECLRLAKYRRLLIIAKGTRWQIHRKRVALQNKLRLWAQMKTHPQNKIGSGKPGAASPPAS